MLSVDTQVYKLKQSRIQKFKQGKLSVKELALCIRYDDWLTIHNNTIYTMSQRQYYSYRAPKLHQKKLITLNQLSTAVSSQILSETDLDALRSIYNKLHGCSTCQFKKYARQATDIVIKYAELSAMFHLSQSKPVLFKYPQTIQPINQKLSSIYPIKFQKLQYSRKPCFDCVAKHIGTAYIKAIQVMQGYSQHAVLGLADLQQAYQQCPDQCVNLKRLLLTCISQSIKNNQLFVPFQLLSRQLDLARQSVQLDDIAHEANSIDQDLKLQLSTYDVQVIKSMDDIQLSKIEVLVKDLLNMLCAKPDKLLWSGYLSRLSQLFMPYSRSISAMLRNRRLFFKQLPQAALNSQYDCSDILAVINQCRPEKVDHQTTTEQ